MNKAGKVIQRLTCLFLLNTLLSVLLGQININDMPLDWTLINGKQVGDTIGVKYQYKAHPADTEFVFINEVVTIERKDRRNWWLSTGHGFAKKTLLKLITNYNNQ